MTLLGLVLAPATSASAEKAPSYSGPAPGSVACQFEARVVFSPGLRTSSEETNPASVSGRALDCGAGNLSVDIKSGRITGSFGAGFGSGCAWNGDQAATLTISWRGDFYGTVGNTTYGGKASFTPSVVSYSGEQVVTDPGGGLGFALPGNANSSSVTGSFPISSMDGQAAIAYSSLTSTAIQQACSQHPGLRTLELSGTIVLGSGVIEPSAITTGPDGALWFTDAYGVGRITTTGQFSQYVDPEGALFGGSITTGPDGALWFTEPAESEIGRMTTSGVFSNYSSSSIDLPVDITTGPDGALWFTNDESDTIGRITTSGGVTSFTDPTYDAGPDGITTGPDGNLWVTNEGSNSICRLTTAGVCSIYISLAINGPVAITTGPDGNLWFTNEGNSTIGSITTSGVATMYTDPSISAPSSITAGPDGNLWFTNLVTDGSVLSDGSDSSSSSGSGESFSFGGSIGSITTSGVVTNYTDPSFNGPTSITVGPDGALWYVNELGGTIGRITTSGVITNYG